MPLMPRPPSYKTQWDNDFTAAIIKLEILLFVNCGNTHVINMGHGTGHGHAIFVLEVHRSTHPH
jgi:hypothetical protein